MDNDSTDRLDRLETSLEAVAAGQRDQAEQQRMVLEGVKAIIQTLAPKEKDGPGLDELIGHMAEQLVEVTGYVCENIRISTRIEETMPGEVVRAIAEARAGSGNGNGGAHP